MVAGMTAERVRWSVMWYSPKKDRIIEKDFESDLTAAMELYVKLKPHKERFRLVTLRSQNVGHPPPPRLRPHEEPRAKTVKRNGKTKKIKVMVAVNPLAKYNRKGIYWCPYCRELRRFERYGGIRFEGILVPKVTLYCPMCQVSSWDFHVRRHNPIAARAYNSKTVKGRI